MQHSVNHPTKEILINTAVELLDSKPGERVLVDAVLEASGISRGSLYHHFNDYEDLLEAAQVRRFSRYVDGTAKKMTGLLSSVKTADQLRDALFAITIETQRDSNADSRMLRTKVLGEAYGNQGFQEKLQVEVDRLTDALEDLVQEAMNRGWFKNTFEARTIALYIQSYSLGKVLNDVSHNKVSEDQWNSLINKVISELFINN